MRPIIKQPSIVGDYAERINNADELLKSSLGVGRSWKYQATAHSAYLSEAVSIRNTGAVPIGPNLGHRILIILTLKIRVIFIVTFFQLTCDSQSSMRKY